MSARRLSFGCVRLSVIEPGTVDTALPTHVRKDLRATIARQTEGIETVRAAGLVA
jgi:hypothetical protein